jgi:hypothetical protein
MFCHTQFPERMFNYNAAASQLYNKEVVSLAILCEDQEQPHGTEGATT